MNIEKNSIKDFNYGLAILRIWMCFEVVLVHFKNWSVTQGANFSLPQRILILYEWIAVPVFILTSFIFTDMNKLSKDNDKIKHRLYRLLIPHFFWAFVYYAIYRILDNIKGLDLEHGIIDLYWQLLLGHSINQTEWFQIDLIVLTLLFIVIFRFCPKSIAIKLTFCIGCLAFYFQYSGKNGAMFDKIVWPEGFQTDYVTYPVGRLCEMVPYAVLGIMLCNYCVFDLVKRYWKYIVIATLLFLSLLFNYQLFPVVERQYGYSGLRYIVIGTMSVFLFYFLPLHWLPKIIKSIIKFFAKYTMAVYFMHRLVATILYNSQLSFRLRLRPGSFYDCIVIYFCCVVTAWLISLIPIKLIRNSVM
ncbi:MAG: acyltransferase [Pseudobutyrivibrio sp.]|nr:acyltransferase [Pseudobutyrivibrio sp.]